MWYDKPGLLKLRILQLALGGSALVVVGCAPTGSHAGRGGEYTRDIMSLYNDPAVGHGARTIEFPVNLAAAQIGDAAPQPAFLNTLRAEKDVFRRVESLPAQESDTPDGKGRDPVRRLESMARDQGADYLLIYGATVDTRTRISPLSAVDLTIVGAFAPITRTVEATARGSAALIDVRTGTIVLTAGSEGISQNGASAVTVDAVADEQAEKAQNLSLSNLADQIVASAHRRSAEENAADETPAARRATSVVAQEK